MSRTWILTGSPENHAATRDRTEIWPGRPGNSEDDARVLMDRTTAATGAGV